MAEKGKRRAGGEVSRGRWHGCREGLGGTRSGAVLAVYGVGRWGGLRRRCGAWGKPGRGVGASVEEVELEG
jgi:hypothetical protein